MKDNFHYAVEPQVGGVKMMDGWRITLTQVGKGREGDG